MGGNLARKWAGRGLFGALLIAYLLYAAAFIHKTSVWVPASNTIPQAARYYVLFDDAMVSMRYAKNLAEGHGLVWNPGGPRVEGFTNPLWVGVMTLVHLVEHDPARTSLWIQALGALMLAAQLVLVRALALRLTRSTWAALGAAIFTAFYLPLNAWTLEGMEVGALALILTAAALGGLQMLERGRFAAWPYALLGFSTLLRLDMAVPLGALTVFMLLADRAHWRRHLIAGPLVLLAFLLPQTLFRLWYYDSWLPNTYALKMSGYPTTLRVLHGLRMSYDFLAGITLLPLLALVLRRDAPVRLVAWLFAGQVLYSTWVGGDAWEWFGGANRTISTGIALWFVLLWVALSEIARLAALHASRQGAISARLILGALAAFLFVQSNATYGRAAWEEWTLQKPPLLAGENRIRVEQAHLLRALTTPEATVAVTAAGIIPYFAERPFIDLLGKNDPAIAKMPARRADVDRLLAAQGEPTGRFLPGHMKWDYDYSIRALEPDIVLEYWLEDVRPYLGDDYHAIWFPPANRDVFMRKDSPHILWERIFG